MDKHYIIDICSGIWWNSIIISGFIITLIIYIGIKWNTANQLRLARVLGILLLSNAVFIHIYQWSLGEWNMQNSLPLNLCSISGILSGLILIFPNQKAYEFLLYWGIPGAFHSYITPELTLGKEGWYLYDYYVMHGGIILSVLYLSLIYHFRPGTRSWLSVWLWSQILVIVVYIIDVMLSANYMYLIERPIAKNPLVIGEWPWYILGFEIAALIHVYVVYRIFSALKGV